MGDSISEMKIILQPNPPTAIASTSLSGGSSPTKASPVKATSPLTSPVKCKIV
jgi:hypothetical protein